MVQLKNAVAISLVKRRINDQSGPVPPGKRQTRCVLKQLIAQPATNLHSYGHCKDPLSDERDSNVHGAWRRLPWPSQQPHLCLALANFRRAHRLRGTRNIESFSTSQVRVPLSPLRDPSPFGLWPGTDVPASFRSPGIAVIFNPEPPAGRAEFLRNYRCPQGPRRVDLLHTLIVSSLPAQTETFGRRQTCGTTF